MIGRIVRLVMLGAGLGYALDRVLSTRGNPTAQTIGSMVVINAPIDAVWAAISDIDGQPRWMTDMKAVRLLTPEPVNVGTRAETSLRVFGISVTDPVTVTEFDPPRRFAIRHDGAFKGHGVITLDAGVDDASTIVRWNETVVPPVLPYLGSVALAPVLGAIFRQDLANLKELVETGSVAR